MYVGGDFDPIDPGEDEDFTMDFVRDLFSGETISSAACDLAVAGVCDDGTDSSPSSRLVGLPSISGTKVTQEVSNCQPGVYYRLTFTITTSTGRVKKDWSHFWCRAPD